MEIKGKTVLITGAARGMGRQHAVAFAREGARVVATDINGEELAGTVTQIFEEEGYRIYSYEHDISDRDACFELRERVESEVGPVDVLVNNAAIAMKGTVMEQSEDSVRRIFDVNFLGQLWMMQAFVPGMVDRGGGHVVNICSVAGKVGVPWLGTYCATKHALVGLTDALRQELKSYNVRFTIVNPGYTKTGMFAWANAPLVQPWQDPQRVSDAVVAAIKKNRAEIFVPCLAGRLTALIRGLGSPWLMDLVSAVTGLARSFKPGQEE